MLNGYFFRAGPIGEFLCRKTEFATDPHVRRIYNSYQRPTPKYWKYAEYERELLLILHWCEYPATQPGCGVFDGFQFQAAPPRFR